MWWYRAGGGHQLVVVQGWWRPPASAVLRSSSVAAQRSRLGQFGTGCGPYTKHMRRIQEGKHRKRGATDIGYSDAFQHRCDRLAGMIVFFATGLKYSDRPDSREYISNEFISPYSASQHANVTPQITCAPHRRGADASRGCHRADKNSCCRSAATRMQRRALQPRPRCSGNNCASTTLAEW